MVLQLEVTFHYVCDIVDYVVCDTVSVAHVLPECVESLTQLLIVVSGLMLDWLLLCADTS